MVAHGRLDLDVSVNWAVKTGVAIALASTPGNPVGAQEPSREYEIKAAFLVNFVRLTEWSEGDSTPHKTICILGENPFGDALSALDGTSVEDGTIETRADVNISEVAECDLLFIGTSPPVETASVLRSVAGLGILTVSETSGFAVDGGMLEMRVERNRVALELNLPVVRAAGLRIKSPLLLVAKLIR